jgi:hypothetical protein
MNEPPVCESCGCEYGLREGCDPSKYCDNCAQERVALVEPMLKKLRDFIEFGPYCSEQATNIVIEADRVLDPTNLGIGQGDER